MPQMQPQVAHYRPLDPLLPDQLGRVHVKGIINRPESYARRALFETFNSGPRFVNGQAQGLGNTVTIQRLDVSAFLKNAGARVRRAPGANIHMGTGLVLSPITATCEEISHGSPFDAVIGSRSQGINQQATMAAINIEVLDLYEENKLNTFVSTTGNWHADSGNVAVGWNQAAGKAVEDIGDAARTVRGDTVFFGWQAWWDFCFNANLLSRMPDDVDRNGIDTTQGLAVLRKFGITKIVIGGAQQYNSSGAIVDIHGDFAWVGISEGYVQEMGQGQVQVANQAALCIVEEMPATAEDAMYLPDGTLLEQYRIPGQRSLALTAGRSCVYKAINPSGGIVLANTNT